jgi:methyltransferase (TIGR00027 family)
MQDQTASKTALATAYMRAAHQILDDRPLLFDDETAVALLGDRAAETIQEHFSRHQSPAGRALRAHVCLRSRFAEDRLRQAVARGVDRYVLVGAGFDTFALRRPAWAQSLRIVEVDHPATQAAKREMLSKAGFVEPENAIFAPADFTRETLGEVLARHGVGRDRPVYFSWLGVSMYLEEAAIDAALRDMAAFAPGSEVTLTFKEPPGTGDSAAASATQLAERVKNVGEAFVSFFTPGAMQAKLLQCGYTSVLFLTPERAREQYFTPSRRDLPAPKQTNIVCASR